MTEWKVRLAGRGRDLRFLAIGLRDPWRIFEEDGKSYLQSARFQGLGDAGHVKRVADEFIGRADLAALARFEGYQGVQTAEVVGSPPHKAPTVTLFAEPWADTPTEFGSATVTAVGAKPPPPPDLNKDASLLGRRPSLEKALRHVREEPGWSGYWRAAEALGEDIGGLDKIVSRGWANQDQYDRFYKTVHHNRHHRVLAPANPMSEAEVRSFLLGWLRRRLELSGGR